ncbi:DUF4936 family protein [Paucibacter sp. R3-3]|uniref:DUF4936 family protein n=1 Tax=Roseateles agri TaxID=3098619 RepID=A0ABU5DH98_9BURK|nr:DUF4936 family protein [Paucibacter sp. R3-3]MDY0745661.1 DUF4936 family protein [Paucibacter sp. R3-3]
MTTELYVYYKVAPAQARAIKAVLQAWPQVRLLRRAGEPETWMEIHTGPDAEASVQALAALLAPHITGPRHVERFEPVVLTAP